MEDNSLGTMQPSASNALSAQSTTLASTIPFLPAIPLELQLLIISYLPRVGLRSCRLVCKYYNEAIRPLLFNRICLGRSMNSVDRLVNIAQSAILCPLVQCLYIDRFLLVELNYDEFVEAADPDIVGLVQGTPDWRSVDPKVLKPFNVHVAEELSQDLHGSRFDEFFHKLGHIGKLQNLKKICFDDAWNMHTIDKAFWDKWEFFTRENDMYRATGVNLRLIQKDFSQLIFGYQSIQKCLRPQEFEWLCAPWHDFFFIHPSSPSIPVFRPVQCFTLMLYPLWHINTDEFEPQSHVEQNIGSLRYLARSMTNLQSLHIGFTTVDTSIFKERIPRHCLRRRGVHLRPPIRSRLLNGYLLNTNIGKLHTLVLTDTNFTSQQLHNILIRHRSTLQSLTLNNFTLQRDPSDLKSKFGLTIFDFVRVLVYFLRFAYRLMDVDFLGTFADEFGGVLDFRSPERFPLLRCIKEFICRKTDVPFDLLRTLACERAHWEKTCIESRSPEMAELPFTGPTW